MSYCCFQIENWNLDLIWKAAMTNCRYAFGIFCVLAGIIFAKNDTCEFILLFLLLNMKICNCDFKCVNLSQNICSILRYACLFYRII